MKNDDFKMRGDYPFMPMPRQKSTTSEFDEKCNDLKDRVKTLRPFFLWYGLKRKSLYDELRSIVFLEGELLWMLVTIRCLFSMRGKMLLDEHIDLFKDLLKEMNGEMQKGIRFIHLSNRCLEDDLNSDQPFAVAMRQDLVDGFREERQWLGSLTANPVYREQAGKLINELGLNYPFGQFGCMGDSFKQHTNMVMNGLMLLACPSMIDAPPEAYLQMFDNTIVAFKDGKAWPLSFEAWKRKVEKKFDILNLLESPSEKMRYLKEFWAALDKREQQLLERYGIEPDNARFPGERTTMCYRIHEHLNNNRCKSQPIMPVGDLQQYLLYVIQKQYVDDVIDRLRPVPREVPVGSPPVVIRVKQPLFKSKLEESLLIDCFNETYVRFFVKSDRQVFMEGKHKDVISLMAYLYMICEKEDYFEKGERGPFFRFCKTQVGFKTNRNERTFRNRLDKLEDVYKVVCLGSSQKADEKALSDFQKVFRIFHGTKKFERLWSCR